MKNNKKIVLSMVMSVIMFLGMALMPAVKASASDNMRDKNKVTLYYREGNYVYHASEMFTNYIRVAKNIPDKKVYLTYKDANKADAAWKTEEAEYVTDLDGDYEIYKVYCGAMGADYDCKIVCTSGDNTYFDDNDGKYYNTIQLGVAPLCSVRQSTYIGYDNFPIVALVQNYGADKDVEVRYTKDNWATYKDVPLTYQKTLEDGTERWEARIDTTGADYTNFQYALYYTVNGTTYWDNYFGNNYDSSYHNNY